MALSAHWTYGVVDGRSALIVVVLHEVSASKASAIAGLAPRARPVHRWPSGRAGRGRPPQAAARRAGLEFVEKLLTTNLTSTDTMERDAGMLLLLHPRPAPSVSLVELATSG
jgi:hypothetical protein